MAWSASLYDPQRNFSALQQVWMSICPPSVKFTRRQIILRTASESSPNADIRSLWKDTSNVPNLQYDTYRNTKGVLESFRSKQGERLKDNLASQGSFFSIVKSQTFPKLNSLWSSAQGNLPKNIFNFTIKYVNNTLSMKKKPLQVGNFFYI